MNCPCTDCPNRWVKVVDGKLTNCHASCKLYESWTEELKAINAKIKAKKASDRLASEDVIHARERYIKRHR